MSTKFFISFHFKTEDNEQVIISQEMLNSDLENQFETQKLRKQCNCNRKIFLKIKETKYYFIIPLQIFGISLMTIDIQLLAMGIPALMDDFQIEQSKAQWATTFSSLGVTTFAIPLSNIAKRYGLVNCLIIYHLLHLILFIILFFINNFEVLCAIRFFTGALQVGCGGNRNALCRLLSYPNKQQNNLLYNKIILSTIQILWPLIIGYVIDKGQYRVLYLVISGIDLLQIIYISLCEQPKKQSFGHLDFLGIICLFITMTSLAFCFSMIGYQKYYGVAIFAGLFILFLILLIIIERKVKDPVIPYKILKQPTIDYLISNVGIMNSSAILSYLMPQIFSHYGRTSQQYSYVTTINGIIALIVSLLMPIVSKKILNKVILIFFGIIGIIISFVFPFITNDIVAIVITYLCYLGLTQPRTQLMLPIFQMSIDQSFSIQMSTLPQTFGNILKSVIIPLITTIFQLCQSGEEITDKEYSTALSIQFSIIIIWNIIFILIIIFRTGQLPNESHKKGFKPEKVIYNNCSVVDQNMEQQKQNLLEEMQQQL